MAFKFDTFSVYVAIDFGTAGIGIAYTFNNNIFVHDKWKSKGYGTTTKKLKSTILFDNNENVASIGLQAKYAYIAFTDVQNDGWSLVENFKMWLFDDTLRDNDDQKKQHGSSNSRHSSKAVFIAIFKHISEICKTYLKKHKVSVRDDKIQWTVTVPTMCNEETRNTMKNWIVESKLADKNSPNQCKIVYEPECAALAIQYYMSQINN
eukprot:390236_1